MWKLPEFIRRRLALKILLALTVGAAMVLGGVIYLNITSQQEQIRERMTTFGREMKSLAYAGIKHPMAVGDSPSIEKQLVDIRDELEDTEIVICDFNGKIVFATRKSLVGEPVSQFASGSKTLATLQTLLATGLPAGDSAFEEEAQGRNYLVTMHRILNSEECHHCHGTSREVLGGLLTRQATDATYVAIASLRNRTIVISVLGFGALIALIYLLLARLVTRPVTELAARAEELAAGDLSVSVPVVSEDAVGTLARSFNGMVHSIKDQIEYASSLRNVIADPLFMVDRDMVITFMNEACAHLTGYSREEAEGRLTCREIFQSGICDSDCPVSKCFATGEAVEGTRTTIIDRSGRKIPVVTSASALKDARGAIIGAVEICRDITDVLEAERLRYIQAIAEREEEMRRYLETRAENLLATLARVAEKEDLSARMEVTDKDDVMDKIARHTNQMLENIETLYQKLSSFSRELELEVARRTMMLQEKTLLLERANRELRELDRLKSSFLANMSHELRTPMNSIIGYTDLLLDRVDGEINEEQEKSLLKVSNNAKHLLQLINDILDMSKIEEGKMELDLGKTDIRELIESSVSTFTPSIKLKNLTVTYDFARDLLPIYVDADKVRQILNNLLSNAVKYTNSGGITIHVRPSAQGIRSGEAPLFLEFCVEDTGIGIKKEDMGKLFDKFSQIDVSTIRQYEGTGLGLSIARGLVVLHKGVIWAESEFGKGTKLYFTLPVSEKMLEKPSEPMIEPVMAELLAAYFNKPEEKFLRDPSYGGKPIRCWEYMHCGQTSCPAYGSRERRCWLISGTHCKGIEVAKSPEKAEFCKGCEIIKKLILEQNGTLETAIAREQNLEPVGRGKIILAIDDNPEVIELIKKNIGDEYRVVGHLEGEGAVEKAREIRPAAITLDIMMPRKNGWQVLQELKSNKETQDIPVLILSIVDEKKMGFSLGAAEYLVKPVEKNILLQKLRNLARLGTFRDILIIDQDTGTLSKLRRFLEEEGYTVTLASNNREAVERIHEVEPDLIIYNLMMPAAGGIDLIEYLKVDEKAKTTPLILLTDRELDEKDTWELNGRIQATLNKGLLSEEELFRELGTTIRNLKLNGNQEGDADDS